MLLGIEGSLKEALFFASAHICTTVHIGGETLGSH